MGLLWCNMRWKNHYKSPYIDILYAYLIHHSTVIYLHKLPNVWWFYEDRIGFQYVSIGYVTGNMAVKHWENNMGTHWSYIAMSNCRRAGLFWVWGRWHTQTETSVVKSPLLMLQYLTQVHFSFQQTQMGVNYLNTSKYHISILWVDRLAQHFAQGMGSFHWIPSHAPSVSECP